MPIKNKRPAINKSGKPRKIHSPKSKISRVIEDKVFGLLHEPVTIRASKFQNAFKNSTLPEKKLFFSVLGNLLLRNPEKNIRLNVVHSLFRLIEHSGRKTGTKFLEKAALTDKDYEVRIYSFKYLLELSKPNENIIKTMLAKKVLPFGERFNLLFRQTVVDSVARSNQVPKATKLSLLNEALKTETNLDIKKILDVSIKAVKEDRIANIVLLLNKK